ncbi:SDR family NAD(P)-dependent oxidoreductase [Miniimonas sp. S16]|uniref:SDR family NAD(P)-dependent oxidoreductase n=1 Tax=Miniimonas sp. S16 TaxID=2171623 RepID=UPI000D525E22|nr:SDR family NAD(P)-dependent oxidoreductase [Miniimonas sp. S16]
MPKTIVITGASSGIGAAAARQLTRAGHDVVLVGRNPRTTAELASELGARHFVADFADLAQVRTLAEELRTAVGHIDVLANNAGGVFGDPTPTVDGFETTFQVNHLAPFLLTTRLMDVLTASRASVIQTSSVGARFFGHLDLDDVQHERDFNPQVAYGTAKLANILFTRELHRRYRDQGIAAAAFHPGVVATSFATESASVMRRLYASPLARFILSSPENGASQLVWLAEGTPPEDWTPGVYYEKKRPARRVNPQVRDAALARRLWDLSAEMLGTERGAE